MPYNQKHSSHGSHDSHDTHKVDYSMKPHTLGDVGLKVNIGGGVGHNQKHKSSTKGQKSSDGTIWY